MTHDGRRLARTTDSGQRGLVLSRRGVFKLATGAAAAAVLAGVAGAIRPTSAEAAVVWGDDLSGLVGRTDAYVREREFSPYIYNNHAFYLNLDGIEHRAFCCQEPIVFRDGDASVSDLVGALIYDHMRDGSFVSDHNQIGDDDTDYVIGSAGLHWTQEQVTELALAVKLCGEHYEAVGYSSDYVISQQQRLVHIVAANGGTLDDHGAVSYYTTGEYYEAHGGDWSYAEGADFEAWYPTLVSDVRSQASQYTGHGVLVTPVQVTQHVLSLWLEESSGQVRITKRVSGSSSGDQSFSGTLSVTTPDGRTATETFSVKADGTWTSQSYPSGSTFAVSETDLPRGWVLIGIDPASGTIEAGQVTDVTITNRQDGFASIKKGLVEPWKS